MLEAKGNGYSARIDRSADGLSRLSILSPLGLFTIRGADADEGWCEISHLAGEPDRELVDDVIANLWQDIIG